MSYSNVQWLWDAQLERNYYWRQEQDGSQTQVFEDGTTRAAALEAPATRPRNIRSRGQSQSLPYQSSPTRPSSSYTYQAHSPLHNPDPTSRGVQSVQLRDAQQAIAGAQYENYQSGRDAHGVQSRTVDGPKASITDPALSARGILAHKKLLGTSGPAELLDEEYKVRAPKFFRLGRVFLILWTEPTSQPVNSTDVTRVRFNETVFTKVRRFVVIREGELSCSAIPILTYRDQGVGKLGLRKYEHTIMYSGRVAPEPLPTEQPSPGEPGMMVPLRVVPDQPGEQLSSMSRAHYGKVYTIEANLKVKPFGMILDTKSLVAQFMQAWSIGQTGLPGLLATHSSQPHYASQSPTPYVPLMASQPSIDLSQTNSVYVTSGTYIPYQPQVGLRSAGSSSRAPQTASEYAYALQQYQAQAQQARDAERNAARRRAGVKAEGTDENEAASAAAAYSRMVTQGRSPQQAMSTLAEKVEIDEGLSKEAAASRAWDLVTEGQRASSLHG